MSPMNWKLSSLCDVGNLSPLKLALATQRILNHSLAIASTCCSISFFSLLSIWQSCMIASGAHLLAIVRCSFPCSFHTWERASRSLVSGYSWMSVKSWMCSGSIWCHSFSNAFSIGSKGSFLLARIPYSMSLWNSSGIVCQSLISKNLSLAYNFLTVILFHVIVPVLSVQRTVAAHNVSTAAIFLVNTFFLDILHAQIARKTVSTTGNSSGNIHIAKVNHESSHFVRSPLMMLYAKNMTIHSEIAMMNAVVTIFFTSFCKRVFSLLMPVSAFPMRPISVAEPMASTLTTHCHWTIMVHENTKGWSSPPGLNSW